MIPFITRRSRPTQSSQGNRIRPTLESLGERVVPSASFNLSNDNHTLVITAGDHQNNNIAIVNNGDGDLTIRADGEVERFFDINFLFVNTGDRTDNVTYSQGSSTQFANVTRDLFVHVNLGDNASGTTDRFTADIFGNVGNFQDGVLSKHTLGFFVNGNQGHDRIVINANHDTDVRSGSSLILHVNGDDGNDSISVNYRGEMDGKLDLIVAGNNGNDAISVNARLDAGSTGSVLSADADGNTGKATVRGDLGNDNLTFAIRQSTGATASVSAELDGGFGFFLDHDIGHETSNVHVDNIEQNFPIQ